MGKTFKQISTALESEELSLSQLVELINEKKYAKEHDSLMVPHQKRLEKDFILKLKNLETIEEFAILQEQLNNLRNATPQRPEIKAFLNKMVDRLEPLLNEAQLFINASTPRQKQLELLKSEKPLTLEEITQIKDAQLPYYRKKEGELLMNAILLEHSELYAKKFQDLDSQIALEILHMEEKRRDADFKTYEKQIVAALGVVGDKFVETYAQAQKTRDDLKQNYVAKDHSLEERFNELNTLLAKASARNQRWEQLAKIRAQLITINDEAFRLDKDTKEGKEASKFHSTIKDLSDQYVGGVISLAEFKSQSQEAVKAAQNGPLGNIKKWQDILVNIALAIVSIPTLGLAYVIPALVKQSIFPAQVTANKSIEKVNSMDNQISEIKEAKDVAKLKDEPEAPNEEYQAPVL